MMSVLKEGFKKGNLYAGAASPLLGAMAHNAVLFFVNGTTRRTLKSFAPNENHNVRDGFIAGACVGFSATVLETPVDLLKVKLQASNEYPNVIAAARGIYSRYGIPGLWQGAGATMLRNVPCFSLYFGFNSVSKEFFTEGDETKKLKAYQMVVGGMAAGFGFWGMLYPLDVIKSRMQVQPSDKAKRKYASVLDCARQLHKNEGSKVFYRGYVPSIVRALIVNGAVFLAFDMVMGIIKGGKN